MKDNKPLQILYTVFLGVLIALFVGVGIATFYEGPEPPEYPPYPAIAEEENSQEYNRQIGEHERLYKTYEAESSTYNRNVSIISLVAAVIFIIVGLVFENRIKLLASAIMLGGIFTLLYSIGRGFAADDSRYVFMVLTVSLAVIIYLGYRKFVSSPTKRKPVKRK